MKMIEKAIIGIETGIVIAGVCGTTLFLTKRKANKELEDLRKKEVLEQKETERAEILEKRINRLNKINKACGVALWGFAIGSACALTAGLIDKNKEVLGEIENEILESTGAIEPGNNEMEPDDSIELEFEGTIKI